MFDGEVDKGAQLRLRLVFGREIEKQSELDRKMSLKDFFKRACSQSVAGHEVVRIS